MRLHKRLYLLLCVFSCLSLAFSSMSLNAAADEQYIRFSYNDFVSIAGDTVTGYYLADGQILKPVTLTRETGTRYSTRYISSVDMDSADSSLAVNSYTVTYSCPVPDDVYLSSDSYVPFLQVDWNFHFSNVTYFGSGGLAYVNTLYSTLSRQGLSQYNYLILGSSSASVVPLSGRANDPNLAGYMHHNNDGSSTPFTSGCYSVYSGSATDIYIGTQYFSNLVTYSSKWYISIICPVINPDYVFVGRDAPPSAPSTEPTWDGDGVSPGSASGTISDNGDGTQNINITVETDNSGLIGGILSGIKNLFVPSDDFLNSWHEDLQDSFDEHLGGISDAVSLIDEQADYLRAATSAEYIYFPELTLPIGSTGYSDGVETIGADYTLIEGRQVELRPARNGNLKILWDFLEFAIDAVCVIAVFNMLQTKYEIFLNPDGEVITYDS